jgi:hypothetical protein
LVVLGARMMYALAVDHHPQLKSPDRQGQPGLEAVDIRCDGGPARLEGDQGFDPSPLNEGTPGQPRKRLGAWVRFWEMPSGHFELGICTGANIASPPIGGRVEILGPYVLDANHGWMEIHPVCGRQLGRRRKVKLALSLMSLSTPRRPSKPKSLADTLSRTMHIIMVKGRTTICRKKRVEMPGRTPLSNSGFL